MASATKQDTAGTDIAVIDEDTQVNAGTQDIAAIVQSMNNPLAFFTTATGEDFASRLTVAQALTDAQPLADNLGKVITLADVIVQTVQITNKNTGEVNDAPRITLIDADGSAYYATSLGLLSSVRNLLAALGDKFGEESFQIAVNQAGQPGRKYFTISFPK
jgi:hypothetical protein